MTDTTSRDAEIARVMGRMVGASYFVMHRRFVASERMRDVLLDHLHWLIGLEKAGKVFLSGPMADEAGAPRGGMTVFRCADWTEARALAAADPFALAGVIEFDVDRWQVNEGRLTLSFDHSDGSVRIA